MKDKEVLERLLGTNKEEQERKIKERLERRKQRLAEGTTRFQASFHLIFTMNIAELFYNPQHLLCMSILFQG